MKDKICLICHTAIDMSKPFCKFEHYRKENDIQSKAWYHVECFRNRMNGASIQNALAQKTMHILDKFGVGA